VEAEFMPVQATRSHRHGRRDAGLQSGGQHVGAIPEIMHGSEDH
jgi:hypothetical protein